MRTISSDASVMVTESPSLLNLLNASRPLEMTVQAFAFSSLSFYFNGAQLT